MLRDRSAEGRSATGRASHSASKSRGWMRQRAGNHCGGLLWRLVREEEHRARNRHQGHVGSRLECGALIVGKASIPLLGVDHPCGNARRGQLSGEISVFGDVVEVLEAQAGTASLALFCLKSSISSFLCRSGALTDLAISGISRSRAAIGHLPTFCDARTTARKNNASSAVVKLMPRSTTGPRKCPDSTMSRATVAPWEKPTTTSHRCSLVSSAGPTGHGGDGSIF